MSQVALEEGHARGHELQLHEQADHNVQLRQKEGEPHCETGAAGARSDERPRPEDKKECQAVQHEERDHVPRMVANEAQRPHQCAEHAAPVFDDDADLRDGVHINAVGAFTPEMQETPSQTIARARVVVDNFHAAYAEAGDLINPVNEGLVTVDHYKTELGHIVAGSATGRSNERQITFFKSVGNAIQDVVVGKSLVERAGQKGIGINIDLFN